MSGEESKKGLKCSNCNAEIKESIKFCSKCGSKNEFYKEKEIEEKTESGKKKVKIPKFVIIIAIIAFVGLFSFNVLAKTIFPDKYAKSAILNSYQAISNDSKKYNEIPGIVSLLLNGDNASEKELSLKITDFSDDYVSSMLSGYGVKFNLQNDMKENIMKLSMNIFEDEFDILKADFNASKDGYIINMPSLYDNPIGVDSNAEINFDEEDSYYYNNIRVRSILQSKMLKASIESKSVIEDTYEEFSKDFINLLNFEKSKNSSSSNDTFTATIKGDDLYDAFRNRAVVLLDDENIKNLITYSIYLDEMYYLTFEEAEENAQLIIDEYKEVLNNSGNSDNYVEINDIDVTISVNDGKKVEKMLIESTLSNPYETVGINLTSQFAYEKDYVNSDYNLKLSSNNEIIMISYDINNSNDGKINKRNTNFRVVESQDRQIKVGLSEEYDKSTKEYIGAIKFTPYYEDEGFNVKLRGNYNGKDTLNFDNLSFGFYDYDFYEINLAGYLKSKDIKSVDQVKYNNVEYLNEMSDMDIEYLFDEFETKLEFIFGNLYYGF